ncbi:SNF2-related protein [Flavitalea sp. BT771]|uniref:SNF2-related protein n=1 Tax=Flavitalea sp. BT771 TaxID=3063329 RepID=UPI0026E33CE8|nr:SNF2-related protein [Flavitalea sp. BT771]MDO6435588.1 SNF2-related protein [Flavitalea sp. BT771]MDV6224488.1 SNF2-related protein [Flavitalea sp. BT771]
MVLTPYHAKYIAYELTRRSFSDGIQKLASTLVNAQVDINPHQVEAALFAFRSPLSKGAILADEVGLGKTIEAGLVIAQKWAERKRRILVITPANLRKQWSQELLDKFFLPSIILEAKSFSETVRRGSGNPFTQSAITICSYQFARAKETFIQQIDWDLVVVDEAHRLRNVYKPGNKIAQSIKKSLADAPKILLTATPLQNSLLELYGLVSIVDEYIFGDQRSFRAQYNRLNGAVDPTSFNELKDRLKPVCKRTLRRQVLEYIKYTNRIALVEEFYPTDDEQRLYDLVTEYLQRDNLYALPASQRKLMTLILRRLLASSTYAISGTLETLAAKLAGMIQRLHQQSIEDSIAADFESFGELKDEWLEEGELLPSSGEVAENDVPNIQSEIDSLQSFAQLANSITLNSKGEKLFTALEKGFNEVDRLGAPKKAIIFTESTRTQEYLRANLESKGYSGQVVLFNGTNNDKRSRAIYQDWAERHKGTDKVTGSRTADMRAALVEYFRDHATLMIATEAAAEGINLQFCSLVINFDLPWNPQRIEQRIGRCHRYGQKFDVVVVNFLNRANAADVRVYELLEQKFNLFSGVFGASDEVLGSIESGVDFEKRIALIFQECRTPDQIATAFNQLQSELEATIGESMHRTRQSLLENFDEEVHEKLKINLQESKEYLTKYESWLWNITRYCLGGHAEYASDEHSFTLLQNPFEGSQIHPGPYKIGRNVDKANAYRINHPLAQAIIDKCKSNYLPTAELCFDYSNNAKRISILSPLVGKSGWLKIAILTVTTFDAEDHLLIAGTIDDGRPLDQDQCYRLFSLSAGVIANTIDPDDTELGQLETLLENSKQNILQDIRVRNANYFEIEIEKLDHWGEDKRNSLKVALKELDEQITTIRKQARLSPDLAEKLALEKQRKELESKRDGSWREYDGAAKEIELSKDKLLGQIEQRLQQTITEESLYTIKWTIK